ncbi:hypothetical protein GCM10023185_18070 [Hymenobacter saemangeumensis]|uniref:SnoaL-like domain-containing protein n=1 Tax=Hymenobacter saemangeumensis TaxID=1084522 RepID=A0ABP8IBL9_9BACT
MKSINSLVFITGLVLCGCNQTNATIENKTEHLKVSTESKGAADSKDKREIQALIRKAINWANSKNTINLLPAVQDKKGRTYTGFDLAEHKQNLQKLEASNLFAAEFINNYNQIILKLNQQLKKGSYGPWLVGDMPSFTFASDVDPWTLCQDVPYDKPNPYDFIETEVVSLTSSKGELDWKWGGLGPEHDPVPGYDPGWKKFKYRFRTVKENNQWKIAYLEGFDLKASTAKSF